MPEINLSDFFAETFDDATMDEIQVELDQARIAASAIAVAEACPYSQREIARRMGYASTSTVQRLLKDGECHNATIATVVRFGRACGFRFVGEFVPLARESTAWLPAPRVAAPSWRLSSSATPHETSPEFAFDDQQLVA